MLAVEPNIELLVNPAASLRKAETSMNKNKAEVSRLDSSDFNNNTMALRQGSTNLPVQAASRTLLLGLRGLNALEPIKVAVSAAADPDARLPPSMGAVAEEVSDVDEFFSNSLHSP